MQTGNPMIDMFGDLGANVGQGLVGFTNARNDYDKRQGELSRQKIADDRETQKYNMALAENRYKGNLAAMQAALTSGDYAGAAKLRPAVVSSFNEAYGAKVPNVAIGGGVKATKTGAMLPTGKLLPGTNAMEVTQEVKKERTFNNEQTIGALWATPGLSRPTPTVKSRDPYEEQGYWDTTGGTPKWVVVSKAQPKPTSTSTVLSYNGDGTATVVPKTPGATIKTKPPAPRRSSGGAKAPTTKVFQVNGKNYVHQWDGAKWVNTGQLHGTQPRANSDDFGDEPVAEDPFLKAFKDSLKKQK